MCHLKRKVNKAKRETMNFLLIYTLYPHSLSPCFTPLAANRHEQIHICITYTKAVAGHIHEMPNQFLFYDIHNHFTGARCTIAAQNFRRIAAKENFIFANTYIMKWRNQNNQRNSAHSVDRVATALTYPEIHSKYEKSDYIVILSALETSILDGFASLRPHSTSSFESKEIVCAVFFDSLNAVIFVVYISTLFYGFDRISCVPKKGNFYIYVHV